jgi:hypothetical protein
MGGSVSAGVKLMSPLLAALQENIVLSQRFLFLLLNDILVYLNPPNGLL